MDGVGCLTLKNLEWSLMPSNGPNLLALEATPWNLGRYPWRKSLLPADYSDLFKQTLMDSNRSATLHVLVNHRARIHFRKRELENQMPFFYVFFFFNSSFLPHHFSLHRTICLTLWRNRLCLPGTDRGTAHLTAPRVNHGASLEQVCHPVWPSGWLVRASLASQPALRLSDFFFN